MKVKTGRWPVGRCEGEKVEEVKGVVIGEEKKGGGGKWYKREVAIFFFKVSSNNELRFKCVAVESATTEDFLLPVRADNRRL